MQRQWTAPGQLSYFAVEEVDHLAVECGCSQKCSRQPGMLPALRHSEAEALVEPARVQVGLTDLSFAQLRLMAN